MMLLFPRRSRATAAIAAAMMLMATSLAFGQQSPEPPSPSSPEPLESLHGTMITLIGDSNGIEFEIWANGSNVRSELSSGDQKIVILQRGDTIYVFSPGSVQGNKTQFDSGLASLALIDQIALVKSKGKKNGSQEVNGVKYDQYAYDADAPHEQALVLLETKTSLPKDWVSVVKNGHSEPVAARTVYRNMQANVEVPDALFELPADVHFADVSAAELMSTPLPAPPGDKATEPGSAR